MVDPLVFILRFLFDFWWIFLPLFLFQIFWEEYTSYKKSQYAKKMQWGFLEIKFPTGITKNPKAMEEVFNSLHAIAPNTKSDLTWENLNLKGFIPKSYTLLIIAHNGTLRFFIRFPLELKEFIKSRFYSQYPTIQFEEVNDPLSYLPSKIPNALFDGETFIVSLDKDDAYPIKTYKVLEYLPKEQQIDPLTTFSEAAWQISNKEWLIFQIFVLPTTPDNEIHGKKWIERGQKVVNKLIGKKESSSEITVWEEIKEFTINLLLAPFRTPQWKTASEGSKDEFNIQKLTPGERKIVELIQEKLGKLGFWCSFRISYFATKDIFDNKKIAVLNLIKSTLKNFSTEDLNSFKLTPVTLSSKASPKKIFLIKRREFPNIRKYKVPKEAFILNSEELATLFHPPMEFVPPTGIERTPIKELPPSPEVPIIKL